MIVIDWVHFECVVPLQFATAIAIGQGFRHRFIRPPQRGAARGANRGLTRKRTHVHHQGQYTGTDAVRLD